MPKEGEGGLGSITEEKEDGGGTIGGTPEVATRRSLPKMAVNFGKKTKEKLTIKTSSSSSSNISKINIGGGITAPSGGKSGLVNGSGDMSEPEENGDLVSTEMNSLNISENGTTDINTPVNIRKTQQQVNNSSNSSSVDLDGSSRSLQVSSV